MVVTRSDSRMEPWERKWEEDESWRQMDASLEIRFKSLENTLDAGFKRVEALLQEALRRLGGEHFQEESRELAVKKSETEKEKEQKSLEPEILELETTQKEETQQKQPIFRLGQESEFRCKDEDMKIEVKNQNCGDGEETTVDEDKVQVGKDQEMQDSRMKILEEKIEAMVWKSQKERYPRNLFGACNTRQVRQDTSEIGVDLLKERKEDSRTEMGIGEERWKKLEIPLFLGEDRYGWIILGFSASDFGGIHWKRKVAGPVHNEHQNRSCELCVKLPTSSSAKPRDRSVAPRIGIRNYWMAAVVAGHQLWDPGGCSFK